jgi:hypothetical protein
MAVRRKNIRDPRYYIREFLARKQPNPVAEKLQSGEYKQQVVPNGKIYNRKQYKQEKTGE